MERDGQIPPRYRRDTAEISPASRAASWAQARAYAASALGSTYKCLVVGAGAGAATQLLGQMFKPLEKALHDEKVLGTAESMIELLQTIAELENSHKLNVLTSVHVNAILGLLKNQLHAHEARAKKAAAEADEDGDDVDVDGEWDVLCTVSHCLRELLTTHGAALIPAVEAQARDPRPVIAA